MERRTEAIMLSCYLQQLCQTDSAQVELNAVEIF
jgi:hypothetical protein